MNLKRQLCSMMASLVQMKRMFSFPLPKLVYKKVMGDIVLPHHNVSTVAGNDQSFSNIQQARRDQLERINITRLIPMDGINVETRTIFNIWDGVFNWPLYY